MVLCLILAMQAVGFTSSDFNDQETSNNNIFTATTLDFTLTDLSDSLLTPPLFNEVDFKPGSSITKAVRVKKVGINDFKYQLTVNQTGGDSNLCNALNVEAKLDGTTLYTGSLTGLTLTPLVTISGSQDDWTFITSLSDNNDTLKNKTCAFNLKVKGWQTDSDGTWGLSDEEVLGNTINSGTWSSTPAVVINEVMWMGSKADSDDEWIELKNTTGSAINLTGWKIENVGKSSNPDLTLSGTIPANGYFLIAHKASNFSAIKDSITVDQIYSGISLNNDGEPLTLKNGTGTVIDQTPDGAWPAGNHGSDEKSMERNNDPSTGWHTCEAVACHSITYWDADANNWGTPKADNLSENDVSSPDFKPDLTQPENSSSAGLINLDLELESTPSAEATPSAEPITPSPEPSIEPEPTITPEITPTPTISDI